MAVTAIIALILAPAIGLMRRSAQFARLARLHFSEGQRLRRDFFALSAPGVRVSCPEMARLEAESHAHYAMAEIYEDLASHPWHSAPDSSNEAMQRTRSAGR
jgi:hypothetical protein